MSSPLKNLSRYSDIVVDTGDIEPLSKLQAVDATTNPSLILKAAKMAKNRNVIVDAISQAKSCDSGALIDNCMDRIIVNFGVELLKHIPGVVSTEVDPSLSFDTYGTIQRAIRLIDLYEKSGIRRNQVLIKIAATWEGIKAAEILEQKGIKCNLTLVFNIAQAVACAEAKVHLISPFVGRILDWYQRYSDMEINAFNDPGVRSVKHIYSYFKKYGHTTIVMAASFRNVDQIVRLSGCDKLTISPALLEVMSDSNQDITLNISDDINEQDIDPIDVDEKGFRWLMNEDRMATEKLSEGIRQFHSDSNELRTFVSDFLEL